MSHESSGELIQAYEAAASMIPRHARISYQKYLDIIDAYREAHGDPVTLGMSWKEMMYMWQNYPFYLHTYLQFLDLVDKVQNAPSDVPYAQVHLPPHARKLVVTTFYED